MTWCLETDICPNSIEYQESITNEQNPSEKKILMGDYWNNCNHKHKECNLLKFKLPAN